MSCGWVATCVTFSQGFLAFAFPFLFCRFISFIAVVLACGGGVHEVVATFAWFVVALCFLSFHALSVCVVRLSSVIIHCELACLVSLLVLVVG